MKDGKTRRRGDDSSGQRNWLLGRGLPTGKELYSKMVDEADDMIMAMEEGREVDIFVKGVDKTYQWGGAKVYHQRGHWPA